MDSGSTRDQTLALLDSVLRAAEQGIVVLDGNGAVQFALAHAERLLNIVERNGRREIAAELTTLDGRTLTGLSDLVAADMPVVLLVREPQSTSTERVIRVVSVAGRGVFLLQDLTDEARRGVGERDVLDVVAHDLRAGLVPIKTYAQMLLNGLLGELTEKQSDALRAVDYAVQKQVDRIGNILDMVKSERGSLELQKDIIPLPDILNKAATDVQRDVVRRKLELRVDLAPGSSLVEADTARVERIVVNLLSRCVRQSSAGGRIGIELRMPEAKLARVRIWDNGAGSDPAELEPLLQSCRIQAVRRLQGVQKADMELACLHDLVALHGGRISGHTAPGTGSTYLLYLPLAGRGGTVPAWPAPPARILCVGLVGTEEATVRDAADEQGYAVDVCATTDEALKTSREYAHPVVIVGGAARVAAVPLWNHIKAQRPEDRQTLILVGGETLGSSDMPQRRVETAAELPQVLRELLAGAPSRVV